MPTGYQELYDTANKLAYELGDMLSKHLTVRRSGMFKQVISENEILEIMSLFEIVNLVKVNLVVPAVAGISDTDKIILIHKFVETMMDLESHVNASVKVKGKGKISSSSHGYYTADFAKLLDQCKPLVVNVRDNLALVINDRFNHLDCEINWLKSKLEVEKYCESASSADAIGHDSEFRQFHADYQAGIVKADDNYISGYQELESQLNNIKDPELKIEFLMRLVNELKVERRDFDWKINAVNLDHSEQQLQARELLRDFPGELHLLESRVLLQALIKAGHDMKSTHQEDAVTKKQLPDFINHARKIMAFRGLHNYSYDTSTALQEHLNVVNLAVLSDPTSQLNSERIVENIKRILDDATGKIEKGNINPFTKTKTAGTRQARTEKEYLQQVRVMADGLHVIPAETSQPDSDPRKSSRPN